MVAMWRHRWASLGSDREALPRRSRRFQRVATGSFLRMSISQKSFLATGVEAILISAWPNLPSGRANIQRVMNSCWLFVRSSALTAIYLC